MNEHQIKNNLRIQYLAKRERLLAPAAAAAEEELVPKLMSALSEGVTTVAGYRPIRREVDIARVMEQCDALGIKLCLPIIEAQDKPLFFRRWRLGEMLEKGRYGVEVPPADALTARPDVILVPLVAFDRQGHRLGYGAGYYDRTIHHLREREKGIKMIGVAYAIQEAEHIPFDEHDERLDMVVTEKEILRW